MSHPEMMIVTVELDDLSTSDLLRASRLRWCSAIIREFRQKDVQSMGFCFDFDGSNHTSGVPFVIDSAGDDCFLRVATKEDVAPTRRQAVSRASMRAREVNVLAEMRRLRIKGGMRGFIHQFGKHSSLVTPDELLSGLLSFLVHGVIDG